MVTYYYLRGKMKSENYLVVCIALSDLNILKNTMKTRSHIQLDLISKYKLTKINIFAIKCKMNYWN